MEHSSDWSQEAMAVNEIKVANATVETSALDFIANFVITAETL